jgi:hypothetical protein
MVAMGERTQRSDRARSGISVSVTPETLQRLNELADAVPGMQRGRLAGELLDELVPTVASVKRRLQITRKEGAARPT